MERNDWNNRNNRNNPSIERSYPDQDRQVDEDMYRGAYRFDNSSDHHNQTTWDGYGSTDRNRNREQDYNRDYNRSYNSSQRHDRGYDHDNYNLDSRYRNQNNRYRSSNNADWDEQYRPTSGGYNTNSGGSQEHRSVRNRIEDRDPWGADNFNADYGPDRYHHGEGENYGNMAGSLSYGYDGTSTYDPDWNSHYDPQSGQRRSYHGNYTSRHPEQDQYRENASRNPSDHDQRNRYY